MRRLGFVLVCTAVLIATAAGPASAASRSGTDSQSVVINGRKFGPKDGLQVDSYRIELTSGSTDEVGLILTDATGTQSGISPMATWGSSYALSTEEWQWWYHGRAKAAGNIYSGKRIVQVCIWYTRGQAVISPRVCSNADDNYYCWAPGPEVTTECTDTIDPFAPPTVFNFTVARIDPNVC